MMRTIVFFTNAGKLKILNGKLTDKETRAKLTADNPIHQYGEDRVYALLDDKSMKGATEMRASFLGRAWNGRLHFVHHSTPGDPNHIGFREALLAKSHALEVGSGYAGLHEREGVNGKPYRWLAKEIAEESIQQDSFENLWSWLEENDPIHDLLADKLDYLHAIMAGQRPEPRKETLAKAITKASKQNEVEELLGKLPKELLLPQHYNTFCTLRDLILSEEVSLTPHQPA